MRITPSGRHDCKTPQVCRGPLPSSSPARTDLVASVHGSCQETISCHPSGCSMLGKIMSKSYRKCVPSMIGLSQLYIVITPRIPPVHLVGIRGAHHGCCTLLVLPIPSQPTLVGSSLKTLDLAERLSAAGAISPVPLLRPPLGLDFTALGAPALFGLNQVQRSGAIQIAVSRVLQK